MNLTGLARQSDRSPQLASIARAAMPLLAAVALSSSSLRSAADPASADLAAVGFESDSATTVIDRGQN
jgi:hypothetical protein